MPDAGIDEGEDAPTVSANKWLKKNGWKQVWPIVLLNKGKPLYFAGPPHNRFLRISADSTYFIRGREFYLDPQEFPILELSWGIEQFPEDAAMDLYERNDRALAIQVLFGEELPTPNFQNLPRILSFFWGETETVDKNYTCIEPLEGPSDKRLTCNYPHVKYIALRSGDEGRVFTDQVNLLDHFQEQFPNYWSEHQSAPIIVGLSFEVQSANTQSYSSARLYSIRFLPEMG